MKKILYKIIPLVMVISISCSCTDFLSIVPKGQRVPTSLADFEALLRDEYTCMITNVNQAVILMNDKYQSESSLSYYPLNAANYNWDTSANRIKLNDSDERTYYDQYAAISSCNLILENVENMTEATEQEKSELAAYATVIRAMCYYVLTNYYADTYESSTASTKLSVPLIQSALIGAPSEQVTIQKMYDFITSTVEGVLKDLPTKGMTILHPSIGAAYAFLARVYLQMSNYEKALDYAELALEENDALYDWISYYEIYCEELEDPDSYVEIPSPMGYDYVENFNFRHNTSSYANGENSISIWRAAKYEDGDTKFASRWKKYSIGELEVYQSNLSGYFNIGGMTTVEVYLIKAECLARAGKIADAMEVVNSVRQTRILPEKYSPLAASDLADAIKKIISVKANEMIFSIIPFADARRLNAEGLYTISLTKVENGIEYSLPKDSHLWTMPFPQGATDNPGNGTLTQNVIK